MSDNIKISLEEATAIHTSPGTLYHSLGHIIRSKIESGEWAAGQRIPSEREMMEAFNVSRATVRQGIENLVKEGILHKIQGKGTFVSPPKIKQGILRILDFSDMVRQNGLNSSSRLLAKDLISSPSHILQNLNLPADEKLVWLQRLILVNQTPVLIESTYLSSTRFPDLLTRYDGKDEPHEFLHKNYGVEIKRAHETFEPVIMENEEAELLGTLGGFPALWVELIGSEGIHKPVVYLTALIRGDRCRTYIDLVFDKG